MKYRSQLIRFSLFFIIIFSTFGEDQVDNNKSVKPKRLSKTDLVHQFLEKVEYEKAVDFAQKNKSGVLSNWLEGSPVWNAVEKSGLEIKLHTTSKGPAHLSIVWRLEDQEGFISLDFFISSEGNQKPIDSIIAKCTFTPIMDVPYHRGPDIGQSSVINRGQTYLLWTYYNIAVKLEVNQEKGTIDLLELGKKIQAVLAKNTVKNIMKFVPKIHEIKLSSDKIQTGDSFEMNVLSSSLSPDIKIEIGGLPDRDHIKYITQNPQDPDRDIFRFKAFKTGDYKVTFTIWDRKTMLSSQSSIELRVEE